MGRQYAERPAGHAPVGPVHRRPAPKFLTVDEFADHFGVSYMTIRRLIGRGHITALRVNRSIRIPITEVDRFARANQVPPGGVA